MGIILNPGSKTKGGTFEQAEKNAKKWLESIYQNGFLEVEMSFSKKEEDGNFIFNFKHNVTRKIVQLEIHGFTDKECEEFLFYPRVYWNGSSCADPKTEDWLEDGFKYRIEYYR
jgi:hypothetical protein